MAGLDTDLEASVLAHENLAPSLFGLSPGGVFRAADVTAGAVRSYRTVSPLPHLSTRVGRGGLFSVALSLGSHPPDVIRHRLSTEPGLSLPNNLSVLPERPSGRLTQEGMGSLAAAVKRPALKRRPPNDRS